MVVFIHSGMHDYAICTIMQALKNNAVVLIGDTDPKIDNPAFFFVHISEFLGSANDFRSIYRHMSTNPHEFELFCFMRWFVLRDFMRSTGLGKVFYLDSDVMLFVNAEEQWGIFQQYEMTLLHRTAAISSFITLKGIESFCDMLLKIYSDQESYRFKKIASHFSIRRDCGLHGGVCDMTLLEQFHYDHDAGGGPGRVGEMMTIIGGSTYDHNINVPDQDFEMKDGVKNVVVLNGEPHVFNTRLNEFIRFNSLHFQGSAKSLIGRCYESAR